MPQTPTHNPTEPSKVSAPEQRPATTYSSLLKEIMCIRNLARTGTPPMSWGMTEEQWKTHKLNKIAGIANNILERIETSPAPEQEYRYHGERLDRLSPVCETCGHVVVWRGHDIHKDCIPSLKAEINFLRDELDRMKQERYKWMQRHRVLEDGLDIMRKTMDNLLRHKQK